MREVHKCLGTVAYLGGLMALPEAFCWAWGNLREFNMQFVCAPGEMIHYTRSAFSLHAHARNALCQEMQGEFLLMLDTDVLVEPDALLKLLHIMKTYNAPVVSAIYRHKALPHHGMLWNWVEQDGGFRPLVLHDPHAPCFRVDAVGAGCLLIHQTALKRLRETFPDEEPFDHTGKYGEDMSFCLRLRQAGIPLYATPQVEAVHLMARGVTDELYVDNWYPGQYETEVGVPKAVER